MTPSATATMPTYTCDRGAYAAAVESLLALIDRHRGTSGARAAAQVLLSAYNGGEFHLDPGAIRSLSDDRHRDAALTVIAQRVVLPAEPHEVVPDGDRRFGQLWQEYADELHVRHRYAVWYRD